MPHRLLGGIRVGAKFVNIWSSQKAERNTCRGTCGCARGVD